MAEPFIYDRDMYENLSDEEKLEYCRRVMKDELGPEYELVKDDMFSERRDMVNEEIFDNYAEQGRLLKRIEEAKHG